MTVTAPKRYCYVVIHIWAKTGDPEVFGVYTTRKEAMKHIRPDADDYIIKTEIKEAK